MPADRRKPWAVLNLTRTQAAELQTLCKANQVDATKVELVRRHTFTVARAGRFDQTVEQVSDATGGLVSVHQVRRAFDVLTASGWWQTIEPARGGGAGGGAGRAPVRFISAFTPAEAEPVDSAERVSVAEPARAERVSVKTGKGERLAAHLYERFYEKPTTTTACADAEPDAELAGVVVASQHETEPAARGVIEHQTVEQARSAAAQAHRAAVEAEAAAEQADELARSAQAELDQAEPSRMRELLRELGLQGALARLSEPLTAEQAAANAQKAAEQAHRAEAAQKAAEAAAQAHRAAEQARSIAEQAEAAAQRIELLPAVTPAQVSRPRIEQAAQLAAATYVDRQAGVRNRAGYIMAMRKQVLSRLDQLLQRPDWCAWIEHADLRSVANALVKVALTETELRSYESAELDQQAAAGARPLQAAG